jgi:hypothetical protein
LTGALLAFEGAKIDAQSLKAVAETRELTNKTTPKTSATMQQALLEWLVVLMMDFKIDMKTS